MDEADVVKGLGALAQVHRLRAFRALVVAGRSGLTPGAMAEALGIAPNTLSFHLKELTHADLVTVTRDGRNLVYRAAFERMNALLGFLSANCCEGAVCAVPASTDFCAPELAGGRPVSIPVEAGSSCC